MQGLAGDEAGRVQFQGSAGRGGAESEQFERPRFALDMSMSEFQQALEAMSRDVGYRADYMNVVETVLMSDRIKSKLLPTNQPVNVAYNSSSFGWRLDPFTGRSAFHEGLDFPATVGTAIVAAAGGVVIDASAVIGNTATCSISTMATISSRAMRTLRSLLVQGGRYRAARPAHCRYRHHRRRSTGPHLHFEVQDQGRGAGSHCASSSKVRAPIWPRRRILSSRK